jgi:hypothetical protein
VRIDPIVNKRVTRENIDKLGRWVTMGRRRIITWWIDESLTEDELIELAKRYPESSQLLAFITMHPNAGARSLRVITKIGLERDDQGVLNSVVTSGKAPMAVLRKLRHHRSESVREHTRRDIEWRQRRRRRRLRAAGLPVAKKRKRARNAAR